MRRTRTVNACFVFALTVAMAGVAHAEPPPSQSGNAYFMQGQAALARIAAEKPNSGRAKNVIVFIGDGMGISTIVASRIFEGQKRGVDGESNSLSFETLPYLALSKTYSTDTQVTDSAASATAIMTGVKTRNKIIGLDGSAIPGNCASASTSRLESIAERAKRRGLSVGAVTTTRITHATPAAVYAHSPFRDWEGDADMPADARAAGCADIARQLVEAPTGVRLDVALGGGRSRFVGTALGGKRSDGRNLITDWLARSGPETAAVSTQAELAAIKPGSVKHLLGLFAPEHLPYEADRATQGQTVPTLTQMTMAALDTLSTNKKGYFLMVEGGRIDMANHQNNAYRALTETEQFAAAIKATLDRVNLKDTLVIVTADHSHGLVISGYAARNAPILGLAGNEGDPSLATDKKPYATLSYATGPGGPDGDMHRDDLTDVDTGSPAFNQQATVPLASSAHSGEDVAIFAGGPQAHLFRGVVEESYTYQVIRRAFGF